MCSSDLSEARTGTLSQPDRRCPALPGRRHAHPPPSCLARAPPPPDRLSQPGRGRSPSPTAAALPCLAAAMPSRRRPAWPGRRRRSPCPRGSQGGDRRWQGVQGAGGSGPRPSYEGGGGGLGEKEEAGIGGGVRGRGSGKGGDWARVFTGTVLSTDCLLRCEDELLRDFPAPHVSGPKCHRPIWTSKR